MKITYSNIDRLTRWELHNLLTDVLIYADSQTDEMPELYTNKLAELDTAYKLYDDALVQEEKASTKSLLAAEDARDHAVRKIYNLIKEYSDYPYEQKKEDAATHLMGVFKPYGTGSSIAGMGQDPETSVLNNLFQDIDKSAETETSFLTLGLVSALNDLRSSNSTFAELQRNRDFSQAQFVAGIVKTTRTDVQNEFVSYADVVNALAIVEGEEKYTTLKLTVNSMIKKYVDKVKKRTKKKEEDTDPELQE